MSCTGTVQESTMENSGPHNTWVTPDPNHEATAAPAIYLAENRHKMPENLWKLLGKPRLPPQLTRAKSMSRGKDNKGVQAEEISPCWENVVVGGVQV